MTIDLKYLIPFALPFVMILVIRALCFVAGAGWAAASNGVVFMSTFIGGLLGPYIVLEMSVSGISWPLRIGGKK